MPQLTKEDKLAILRRLIKRVDKWLFGKSLPMTLFLGENDLSEQSQVFREWQLEVTEAITLIFGKHSHYLLEFNEITYTDLLAALQGNKKGAKASFWKGLDKARALLEAMVEEVEARQLQTAPSSQTTLVKSSKRKNTSVFIGHGRSPLWLRVKSFLEDERGLRVICYESESRAAESIVPILEKMLAEANFAVLILTGEDKTATGSVRARQNVIHEVGLFQSKLGFNRAILLRQEGLEDFTNVDGLQYIPFTENRIEQSFYELENALKREGLLS